MDASPQYRWAALTLIVGVAIVRLFYLAFFCPFDLAPDEAHYWEWSRQLDWCYYSKGPLVAWLIRASCELFGDTTLAVRLPAVVCGSLLLVGLYTLTVQIHQSPKLGFAVVALALTLPIVHAGSLLMTIDAPFTCAWMWALVFAWRALTPGPSSRGRGEKVALIFTGACILVGVLAKHTMVLFVPSLALFLLTTPSFRHHLKQPGLWIMTSIGALGGVPILAWNALNGWVSLRHTQGHAGLDETAFHWLGPFKYLGGQFAILLGFWFVVWMLAMWTHRPPREDRPPMRFLWWMSLPTFVFFGLFALKNDGGEANWPVVAYLSGLVLAAGKLSAVRPQPSAKIGLLGAAALGVMVTLVLHEPIHVQPVLLRLAGPATRERPLPVRRFDPTARLRGWRFLAAEVNRTRAELRERGIEPVLASERWTQAGELAFYCDGHPNIYCMGLFLGDRHSQYDLWRPNPRSDPGHFTGRTFLLVDIDAERMRHVFERIEPPRKVAYRENGVLVAEWTITVAHGFGGFRQVETIGGY